MIGRRYAHVIWVACQGETVRGYAFVKDHKILEIATEPGPPPGPPGPARPGPRRGPGAGLSRGDHPRPDGPPGDGGRRPVVGPDHRPGRVGGDRLDVPRPRTSSGSSTGSCPSCRAGPSTSGTALPIELGLTVGDAPLAAPRRGRGRQGRARQAEPSPPAPSRPPPSSGSLMGHTGIDRAVEEDGVECSTGTAIDAARVLFPVQPIWRSPLDSATA